MLRLISAIFIVLLTGAGAEAQSSPPVSEQLGACRQMVVVTSTNWIATTGTMRRFERVGEGWQMNGPEFPVVLGRGGLGWGRGINPPQQSGPEKREGDGRSPAGVFALPYAFGYAPADSVREIKLPYVQCLSSVECVDDTNSQYYNIVVDRQSVTKADWNSSEKMRMKDDEYRLGIFIAHNTSPTQPGGGSCVFMHIWKGPGIPTSGCTAMSPGVMESLLGWLDAQTHPVLVQLPDAEYRRLQKQWALPSLTSNTP
jgi:D-alanyl-D-alanine dipeptidase